MFAVVTCECVDLDSTAYAAGLQPLQTLSVFANVFLMSASPI